MSVLAAASPVILVVEILRRHAISPRFPPHALHADEEEANHVHPSARRRAFPLAMAERLHGQAYREGGLIPEISETFLDDRLVLLQRSFVCGQIPLCGFHVIVPEQNAGLLDSFLSRHHCRERLAEFVKADFAFDSSFLREALDDADEVVIRATDFAGEDEVGLLRAIALLAGLQALQQSIVNYNILFTRRGILRLPLDFGMARERPFRLRGDIHS